MFCRFLHICMGTITKSHVCNILWLQACFLLGKSRRKPQTYVKRLSQTHIPAIACTRLAICWGFMGKWMKSPQTLLQCLKQIKGNVKNTTNILGVQKEGKERNGDIYCQHLSFVVPGRLWFTGGIKLKRCWLRDERWRKKRGRVLRKTTRSDFLNDVIVDRREWWPALTRTWRCKHDLISPVKVPRDALGRGETHKHGHTHTARVEKAAGHLTMSNWGHMHKHNSRNRL